MKKYLLAFVFVILASSAVFAADLKMILDSTDGSSAVTIQNQISQEVARIDSSGKVGIGTTATIYNLDVNSTRPRAINAATSAYGGYAVYGAATDTSTGMAPNYGVYGSAASGYSGSAGVYGVASSGFVNPVYGVYGSASGISGRGVFGTESNTGYGGYFSNTSSGVGLYATSNSGYAGIFNNGNVGIGTQTPGNLLTLQGGATPQLTITQPAATDVLALGYNEASYAFMATLGSHPLTLWTSNIERMRVSASGNVGIGTTNPAEKLEVAGNLKITGPTSSNPILSNQITSAVGNYGLEVMIDGAERASVDRLGNGYFSNTLTLASVSAPSGAAGKMYFNSSTHRLNYHDGTQWIEIDPAYTNKPLKSTPMYTVSGANTATMAMLTPGTDIIITGILGNTDWQNNQADCIRFNHVLLFFIAT